VSKSSIKSVTGEVVRVSKRALRSGQWAHEIVVDSTEYTLFTSEDFCPVGLGDRVTFSFRTRREQGRGQCRSIQPSSIDVIAPPIESGQDAGYVYVLTNRAMPGLVKLGFTTRSPAERAQELSASTGVPAPFKVASAVFVRERVGLVERACHAQLKSKRVGKEFFKIRPAVATETIQRVYAEISPKWAAEQSAALQERAEELARRREQAISELRAKRAKAKFERSPEFKWSQSGEFLVVLQDFSVPPDANRDAFGHVGFVADPRSLWEKLIGKPITPDWLQLEVVGRPGYRRQNLPPWCVIMSGVCGGRRVQRLTGSDSLEDKPTLRDALIVVNSLTSVFPVANRRLTVTISVELVENPKLLPTDAIKKHYGRLIVERPSLASVFACTPD
jgi:hypothetical protein